MGVKHTFRWRDDADRTESLTPLKAIKRFCFQCMGNSESAYRDVKTCTSPKCALYPFRLGKLPRDYKELSPERKAQMVANLEKARERKKKY